MMKTLRGDYDKAFAHGTNWLDDVCAHTVVVHTKAGGPSIKGNVVAVHDDALVLEDAVVLEPTDAGVQHVVLNGTVAVPRGNVEFYQRIAE